MFTPIVTEEMRKAGVDILERSDYGRPVMFETTDQIVEEIFLAMRAVALKQCRENKNGATHCGIQKAAGQQS